VLFVERLLAAPASISRALRDGINDEVQRRKLPHVEFATGVIVRGAHLIKAGKNVFFDQRAFLTCNFPDGFITMGDNVEIGPYSILWGGGGITIGSDVHLGAHVHITSMEGVQVPADNFDPMKPLEIDRKPVVIGSHVLICSNSVVVPGVTIGHHAMVAAGAVVVSDVPPFALVAGVPARVIRYNNQPQPNSSAAAV
jgi:galactoside O-acetyltransferase